MCICSLVWPAFTFLSSVPALTLNFVEKMLVHKEKLSKTAGRHESSFTDDGFALGLAYILRVLDQSDLFNSLHWFDSVNDHIRVRRQEGATLRQTLQQQQRGGSKASSAHAKVIEEEIASHQMSLKKLTNVQTEFDLFFYSFSGATIFFQDIGAAAATATGVDGTKEEKAEGEASPVVEGAAAPPAPDVASIPVPPPMDGGFVTDASAPPAPPMLPAADGMVVGVGAPPPPPPPPMF